MRMVKNSTLDQEEECSILLIQIEKDILSYKDPKLIYHRTIMKIYMKFILMESKFTQDRGVGSITIHKQIRKGTLRNQKEIINVNDHCYNPAYEF